MTDGAALDRPHVYREGHGGRPLLLLHGTGGDERDLLPLGRALSPASALLSVRGAVREGRSNRFFRRMSEGVFDEPDLRRREEDLAAFVAAASERYALDPAALIIVGFSNGANIGSALLAAHPERVGGAALFAAMPPFALGFDDESIGGRPVVVSNGTADPIAGPKLTAVLTEQLQRAGADVHLVPHGGGHQVEPATLPVVRRLLGLASSPATSADP